MPIGIRDEHDELRLSLQRWSEAHCPPAVTRAALDADDDTLPDFWAALGAQGMLGIHLPEEFGGQGAGMLELAVVAEELGRAAAPGPWSSTAVVGAVVAGCGSPTHGQGAAPGLADGTVAASLVVPTGAPDGSAVARPGLTGPTGPGRLAAGQRHPPAHTQRRRGRPWCWPRWSAGSHGAVGAARTRTVASVIEPLASFDPTRRSASWTLDATRWCPRSGC